MRFAKGHGTGNDFVILPDPDGQLELSPQLTARICDRHRGLGADGILRVVRSAAMTGEAVADGAVTGGAGDWARQAVEGSAPWFMDYRNADGTVAEMCGNGIRVFARYLLDSGLASGPELLVGTRAGVRAVRAADGQYTAEMGPARVTGSGSAELGGRTLSGLAISVGNPHLACVVDDPVMNIDLSRPPVLDPAQFPDGANVEVIAVTGDRHAEMRVYERGSGVTLSCGTGAVAAAVAAAAAAGMWPPAGPAVAWTMDVPGGRLFVTPSVTNSLLTGPAVIIATGELDEDWLRGDLASAGQPAGHASAELVASRRPM